MPTAPTILPEAEGVLPEEAATLDDLAGPSEALPRVLESASADGFGTTVLPEIDHTGPRPRLRERSDPRFVALRPIGEGGLGEIVAAVDNDIGRTVAIKRIRSDRLSRGTLIRFLREIRTVGRLEHANIVPIHDVGRDQEGALYFVMRYVDGETLEAIIERLRAGDPETHRRYGFERRVQIVAGVLEALAYAHAHGVVHRDIKPANVMVGRYGEVLLLDWGIARLVEAADQAEEDDSGAPGSVAHTQVGAVMGTPGYMSPEQARGEPGDARSDIYSVSVMLHELLTLRHYLEDCASIEEMIEQVPTRAVPLASMVRSSVQDPVPMDLSWFVHQGVHKDPTKRYQSVDEMLARLERRAEGDIPVQCHITLTKHVTNKALRFVDRHIMAMAAVMMVGAMGLLGGAVALVVGLAAALAAWA